MSPAAERPTALLLLDLQEAICREDGEVGRSGLGAQASELDVLSRAARCLANARARGLFVAFSRIAFDPEYLTLTSASPRFAKLREAGLLQRGTPGAEICAEVAPAAGELVVEKTGVNPFQGTPLMAALLTRGITNVLIGGVATEHVVESAARHACDAGLQVTVLADLCASQSPELRRHALENTLPFYAEIAASESALLGPADSALQVD